MAASRLEWNNAPMRRPQLPHGAGESGRARALRPAPAPGAALLLVLAATFASAATTGAARIAFSDCRLAHPAGLGSVPARCGSLTTPEDPNEPGGRQIALHVAVVPALDRRRPREPLFIVAGGPGQAAADFYAVYAGAFSSVTANAGLMLDHLSSTRVTTKRR